MPAHTEWEHGPEGWTFTLHIREGEGDEVLAHELGHIVTRVRYGIDEPTHSPCHAAETGRLAQALSYPCTCRATDGQCHGSERAG